MATLIHNVEVSDQKRYVTDPQKGLVLLHDSVIQRGSSAVISSPEYGTFEVREDGSFEVPEELAEFLCKQPQWFEGPNPFRDDIEAEVEKKNEAEVEKKSAPPKTRRKSKTDA